jgi:hypothetical protein
MSTINPAEFKIEVLLKQPGTGNRRTHVAGDHDASKRESLLEEIQAASSELEWQIAAGALDPASALNVVVARTLTLIGASGAAIGLVIGSDVVCCATAGTAPDIGASIKVEEGLSGECVRSGKIVRSNDTAQDTRVEQAVCQALSMRSAMAVPIRFAGSVIGVFEVFSAEPNAFDDQAALAMSQLAEFIGGVANRSVGQSAVEPAPAAASTVPALPAESSGEHRGVVSARSPHRWRAALLIAAALATAAGAVSYRVRDMIRSTRSVHRPAEISAPSLQAPSLSMPAAPVVPLSSEPAIAREDGQVAVTPDAMKPSPDWRRTTSSSPVRSVVPRETSLPLRQMPVDASVPPRKLEVTPEPPTWTLVQPATQRDAVIGPLLKVPVANPKLVAPVVAPQVVTPQPAPPAQAQPGKPRFVHRVLTKPKKLKVLIEKDSSKGSPKEKKGSTKTRSNESEGQASPVSTQSP